MTRAISRDSFYELKQYLGVHLQQGRAILDADWNEAQDIMATLAQRLGQNAFRDGVLNEGFEIDPVMPVPWGSFLTFEQVFGHGGLPFLFNFPQGQPFDAFDAIDNWALPNGAAGKLRISRDRPYEGKTFLRLSDHTGVIQLTKTLPSAVNLSSFQFAHFRFRVNQAIPLPPATQPGTASFFMEDTSGNRSIWRISGVWNAQDRWAPAAAVPLDQRFQILDLDLLPPIRGQQYNTSIIATGAPAATATWALTAGGLPTGLSLTSVAGTTNATLTGTPTVSGTFNFTLSVTSGGVTAPTRAFQLKVQDQPTYLGPVYVAGIANDYSGDIRASWEKVKLRASKQGTAPADLTSIKKYGFEVFQQSPALVWDFDALYLSNRSTINTLAANNFTISGPYQKRLIDAFLAFGEINDVSASFEPGQPILFPTFARSFPRSPRAYVNGLSFTQTRDVLYSDQADPNDPVITTPTGTAVRKDLVYFDVWREPVTYVEDPELREIALGGPDTATRMRLRQRVRVAQGGSLPTDSGIGGGTLATEGSYTDRSNRLYLVEVDTPGDIGTATVRWSEDNGSTIQRVIEAIPPGSTKIKVEDASVFQPGDFILIRKEFGDEEHRIASISGNTITLQAATGAQLALLPAGVRGVANFTTFALSDRPKVQRWNAFHAAITADSADSTISAPVNLSFGVKVRFGGRALRKGDFWTFRTRYLAGDDATGISATGRIETVDYQPPQGVVHQYTPLALLYRDPTAQFPERIQLVRDERYRAGPVVYHRGTEADISFSGTAAAAGTSIDLGSTTDQSLFVCIWSGTISGTANAFLTLEVDFFGNDMTTTEARTNVHGFGLTTFVINSASSNQYTLVVVKTPSGDSLLGSTELVAARAYFSLPNGGSAQAFGKLDIIEVKNRILDLSDAL
jgi:hypothetical protein